MDKVIFMKYDLLPYSGLYLNTNIFPIRLLFSDPITYTLVELYTEVLIIFSLKLSELICYFIHTYTHSDVNTCASLLLWGNLKYSEVNFAPVIHSPEDKSILHFSLNLTSPGHQHTAI